MKKYTKKIALILALALSLAIAIPALASETTIDGSYELSDIQVIVPQVGTATLNPYKLPVKIYADDADPANDVQGTLIGTMTTPGQIATRPLVGVNMSEIDLNVGATVSGTTTGKFKFATSAPKDSATTNTGLVYLEVKQAGRDLGYSTTADATTVSGGFNGSDVLAELNGWAHKTAYDAKGTDVITVGKKEVSKSEMCKILKGIDNDGDDEIDTPDAKGYFVARLDGSIVKKPKKAWSEGDGFSVKVVWDFEPA